MRRVKILAVDDNFTMRKLLESALKNDYEVKLAKDGAEALEIVVSFLPDIVILDIMLPDMSGYEICSQLKSDKRFSELPVIMLSAKTGTTARATGYNLGAINYVEKPFEISELKAIINSTLKGRSSSEAIIRISNLEIDLLKQSISIDGNLMTLTSSEFKLISHLAKKPNQVFSREILVGVISPNNLDVTDRTVDNHISSLRKKLKEAGVRIKSIYSEGYKLVA
jgi:two-component system phosphate regulon response regulator PhoB